MTHIWQELRSTEWLTATPARGCSLILLGLCTIGARRMDRGLARGQLHDTRRRRLARFRGFHDIHANGGARAGRHRLGENSIGIFGDANVGAGVHLAYAVQIALALMLAASLAWLWQSNAVFELKASALATASLLAAPCVLDYEFVLLAVAIVFFVRRGMNRGFHDYEISLAVAWFKPLLSRAIAGVTGIPLACWCCWQFTFSHCSVRCGIAWDRRSRFAESRKRDLICSDVLVESSTRLQCGKDFRLFAGR